MPTYLCSSTDPAVDFYYCPGANPEFQRVPDRKPLDPKIVPGIRIEVFKALANQTLDPAKNGDRVYLSKVSVIEVPG